MLKHQHPGLIQIRLTITKTSGGYRWYKRTGAADINTGIKYKCKGYLFWTEFISDLDFSGEKQKLFLSAKWMVATFDEIISRYPTI